MRTALVWIFVFVRISGPHQIYPAGTRGLFLTIGGEAREAFERQLGKAELYQHLLPRTIHAAYGLTWESMSVRLCS
jgi:hypothetical protein